MSDLLEEILAHKASEVQAGKRAIGEADLRDRCAVSAPPRGFAQALRACIGREEAAVIAELKKASPSKGLIRENFDAAAIARAYEAGGACCLSVLTDEKFFQGGAHYLTAAHRACALPILRKDFMIDPWQVLEARAWSADAILLIVAALSDAQMGELYAAAVEQHMDVLIEVHNQLELERALALPGGLLGINNRNLRNFSTRLETTLELLPEIGDERMVITESGIKGPEDMRRMMDSGVYGFLIGEHLMRAPDPGQELARWLAGAQAA